MRSCGLSLLCLVLWDGSLARTTVVPVFRKVEGDQLLIVWNSQKEAGLRMLCKNECGERDILLQTSSNQMTNDRYSISVEKKGSPSLALVLITVVISNLVSSDSGRYRYVWKGPTQNTTSDFNIEVVEDKNGEANTTAVYSVMAGEDISIPCVFYASGRLKTFVKKVGSREDILVKTRKDEKHIGRHRVNYTEYSDDLSLMYVTVTNMSTSDSGFYHCRLDRMTVRFWLEVRQATSASPPVTVNPSGAPPKEKAEELRGLLIWILIAILICAILILTLIILAVCKKRDKGETRTSRNPNMEHNYENIAQAPNTRMYQGLRLENMNPPYSNLHWAITPRHVPVRPSEQLDYLEIIAN